MSTKPLKDELMSPDVVVLESRALTERTEPLPSIRCLRDPEEMPLARTGDGSPFMGQKGA